MNFKIFQVKRSLVGSHTQNYSDLENMNVEVDLNNYNMVYKGVSNLTKKYELLEALFEEFNINHPENFEGRSMSVSDIVQLDSKYYFCDSVGWREVLV